MTLYEGDQTRTTGTELWVITSNDIVAVHGRVDCDYFSPTV